MIAEDTLPEGFPKGVDHIAIRDTAVPGEPNAARALAGLETFDAFGVTEPLRTTGSDFMAFPTSANTDRTSNVGLHHLVSRTWNNRFRLGIFAVNGMNVFAVGLLIQVLLVRYVEMNHVSSYIVQTAVSVQMNFLLSRYLTWRDRSIALWQALTKFNVQQLTVTGLGLAGYAELDRLGMNYIAANVAVTAALTPVSFISSHKWSMGERTHARWRVLALPWPLLTVLAVQVGLSLKLIWSNTAFEDEALYLWAGHLELAHWLHGTPIPAFPSYFSGAPVIYPPLAALADSFGGLAAARLLSLVFMLCSTCLLWGAASRLYGRRSAFFSSALFVGLGPSMHLSAFATYDAMSLCLVAVSAWCVVRAGTSLDESRWIALSAAALILANATKYASTLFDPVVIAMAILTGFPKPGGKYAFIRGAALAAYVTAGLILLLTIGGGYYMAGVAQTTLTRSIGDNQPLLVLEAGGRWIGVVATISMVGALACVRFRRDRNPYFFLPGLFAAAAFLAPIEQARIHTLTSLDKHSDFGAWFAAIGAGFAINLAISHLNLRVFRIAATSTCVVAVFLPIRLGFPQAQSLFAWPNAYTFITTLEPLVDGNNGRILIEIPSVPEYYFSAGSQWWRWSNTRSIILPSRHSISVAVGAEGNPNVYAHFIKTNYFSIIALNFEATPSLDRQISGDLARNHAYSVIAVVPYGNKGRFVIWRLNSPGGSK